MKVLWIKNLIKWFSVFFFWFLPIMRMFITIPQFSYLDNAYKNTCPAWT